MKKIVTVYALLLALFFSSCAPVCYKEPSALHEKETIVHNVNNIFN